MILGIDQGTTGSTAVLIDSSGKFLKSFTSPVPQHFPQAGWVEHDPEEIFRSVAEAVRGVIQRAGISARQIEVIGLTNQRETVSIFEDDKPLHRFIVWQDRRTAKDCLRLTKHKATVQTRNGTPIDPYFSSTKIAWLLKHLKIKNSKRGLRFRTIDSFLFKRFCHEDATEITNAHRTQLLNIKSAKWDSKLFSLFDIDESLAPPLVSSEGFHFKTKGLDFLPDGIPVQACLGDQQAALFAQLGWQKGVGKITFGTGSFILLNTGDKPVFSKNRLVSTIALQWKEGKCLYALEGSVFICGAWIQWLRDQLKIIGESSDIENLAAMQENPEGVMVIPALTGLGAPFWNPNLRGAILGLSRGTGASHIARASLEALCFQNLALILAMKKDSKNLRFKEWRVDGGAVRNNLLLEVQANTLNSQIIRPKNLEATATGAALLAAKAQGLLSLEDIEKNWEEDRRIVPHKPSVRDLQQRYKLWFDQIRKMESY